MCISNRDADDDTLPVAVIGADDTLAAQQPSYYSLLATTA
jgi:hypothetical protein